NFGYGVAAQPTDAAKVARNMAVGVIAPGQEIGTGTPSTSQPLAPAVPAPATTPVVTAAPTPASVPTSSPAPTPAVTAIGGDTAERVRKAAFNITSGFEGGGYAAYQTFDSGIVSYGRFQFTLAAGSFITVINRYLERSNSPAATELRGYMPRINAKDEGLRQDARLKELCISAASDAIMQQIQDQVAVEGYYQPVIDLTIAPRGIKLPLSYALIFDIAINHGRFNHLIPKTEEVLGVPSKSRLGDNGVSEVQFTTMLANVRRDNLYALAEKLKLPGLRKRGDFWVGIVGAGDWSLQGDAAGTVHFNGKTVQVKNP
ncbi:MAG: chitosanase, partial [Anaerolineae bacterium]|nr:chitosanase [Anaerolineae bacterium]